MIEFNFGLIWTAINIVVLFLIYRVLLYKRVKGAIDARRQQIKSQYNNAAKAEKKAKKLKKQYETSLKSALEESQKIVADAKTRGEAEYNRIVAEANAEASKIIKDANAAIEMERESVMKDARSQITELAMMAAAKIIGESATVQSDENLYNDFLNKTGGQ